MRRFHGQLCALLITGVLASAGCMATYTGGDNTSPDGKYVVSLHVRGAYGYAYTDQTVKTAFVTIIRVTKPQVIRKKYRDGIEVEMDMYPAEGKQLLQKKYRLKGSDVFWDANWDKDDDLTLVFHDYDYDRGPRVKRRILAMIYHFDSKTGLFVERPSK